MSYDPSEQDEIIAIFADMLRAPTRDGGRKRNSGTKPSWRDDPSHLAAVFSHLSRYMHGELSDPDSGAHPLVHLAWRALAVAWQDEHGRACYRCPTVTMTTSGRGGRSSIPPPPLAARPSAHRYERLLEAWRRLRKQAIPRGRVIPDKRRKYDREAWRKEREGYL